MAELDPTSPVPLYRQLASYFVERIESGNLSQGERLPATRELAGQLGLNRTTVSAAYELLEGEGWISGQVGRGSFVRHRNTSSPNWAGILASGAPRQPSFPTARISFAQSRPSESLFPIATFRESADAVLRSPALPAILQLGSAAGYEPLRQYLLEDARREGNANDTDDILITNGCQQALSLLRDVLVRPGDSVALEDPVYPGLRNIFTPSGAVITGVETGAQGPDISSLASLRAKLAVLTPSFQNPTGGTIPLRNREAILRTQTQVFVENDIYSPLRYRGNPEPALKHLDRSGRVALLRSFSKIAFPGLRVGWIVAPRPLIQRLTEAKQVTDLHTDQFSQAVLLHFAESGRLADHQSNMLFSGRERLQAAVAAVRRFFPFGVRFSEPEGGMNLWLEMPAPFDSGELLRRALPKGVSFLPGTYFSVSRESAHCLRLSFAGLAPHLIAEGIEILGALATEMRETERSRDREPVPAMV